MKIDFLRNYLIFEKIKRQNQVEPQAKAFFRWDINSNFYTILSFARGLMFVQKTIFRLFKLTELTLLQNIEVNDMSNKNPNSPSNNKNRLHVLGIDAEIDPCIGQKQ
ncbi:MAG: hypothetical protein FWC41_11895, partial [Firmicutes bacterium]|nr:hypothetical protein [Bacillota bacterium]